MLKTLRELLKKLSVLQVWKTKKIDTKKLEKSGQLIDLSKCEFEDIPINPYGEHLGSMDVCLEDVSVELKDVSLNVVCFKKGVYVSFVDKKRPRLKANYKFFKR